MKGKEKKSVGRPKESDRANSYTVSLKVSERNSLVKKFGSLTKAIKSLIK